VQARHASSRAKMLVTSPASPVDLRRADASLHCSTRGERTDAVARPVPPIATRIIPLSPAAARTRCGVSWDAGAPNRQPLPSIKLDQLPPYAPARARLIPRFALTTRQCAKPAPGRPDSCANHRRTSLATVISKNLRGPRNARHAAEGKRSEEL